MSADRDLARLAYDNQCMLIFRMRQHRSGLDEARRAIRWMQSPRVRRALAKLRGTDADDR